MSDDDTTYDRFNNNKFDSYRNLSEPPVTVVKNRSPIDYSLNDEDSPPMPHPIPSLELSCPVVTDKWSLLKYGMKLIFITAVVCCGLYIGLLLYHQTCDNPHVRRMDTASKLEQAVRTAQVYRRGHIGYSLLA